MPFHHQIEADMPGDVADAMAELRRCCGQIGTDETCAPTGHAASEASDPAAVSKWQGLFARNHAR